MRSRIPRTRRQWYAHLLDGLEQACESATSRAFERAGVPTVEIAALAAQAAVLAYRLRTLTRAQKRGRASPCPR